MEYELVEPQAVQLGDTIGAAWPKFFPFVVERVDASDGQWTFTGRDPQTAKPRTVNYSAGHVRRYVT